MPSVGSPATATSVPHSPQAGYLAGTLVGLVVLANPESNLVFGVIAGPKVSRGCSERRE
jgi:hypothetical protein